MRKSIILVLSLLILLALTIGCKKKEVKDDSETIFAVDTIKAVKGEINDYIELNGDVKSKNEVNIYPDNMGKYVPIDGVFVGKWVNRGEYVAYVDPSKPGMDYALSPVKSTISGTVTSLPIEKGETVNPQTSIAKVGNLNDLEIVTYVAEKYIKKMRLGLKAIISSEAISSGSALDNTIYASISEISPVVDPMTRMMEIKLKLIKPDVRLKAGMFVEIKIITENKENIVKVPADCVVKKFGVYSIFIINRSNEKSILAVQQKVDLGIQIDNIIEITSGLTGDEEVVYRGQSLLENNTKVKIIKTVDPLPKMHNL